MRIFDREQQDRLYAPSAYFVAQWLGMLPQLLLTAVLMSLPVYFGTNLRSGGAHYAVYLAVSVAVYLAINSFAWMVVSMTRTVVSSFFWANVFNGLFLFAGGFYVTFKDLPIYVN